MNQGGRPGGGLPPPVPLRITGVAAALRYPQRSILKKGGAIAESTGSYERDVDTLERELGIIEDTFRGLSDDDWRTRTHLQPIDPELPRWTLLELAAHFDISIKLTRALIAKPQDRQTSRDRVSFFIFSRNEVAPVVYDYAVRSAEGKTPTSMLATLQQTFAKTIQESQTTAPDTVGPGYYALIRL